jgi:hypothetical protein
LTLAVLGLDPEVMSSGELAPRAPRSQDVAAMIGLLATLEGELMTGDDAVPDWASHFARRLSRDGLLAGHSNRELRQTLNDLNHRLRYVLGEYDEPIDPMPVL